MKDTPSREEDLPARESLRGIDNAASDLLRFSRREDSPIDIEKVRPVKSK